MKKIMSTIVIAATLITQSFSGAVLADSSPAADLSTDQLLIMSNSTTAQPSSDIADIIKNVQEILSTGNIEDPSTLITYFNEFKGKISASDEDTTAANISATVNAIHTFKTALALIKDNKIKNQVIQAVLDIEGAVINATYSLKSQSNLLIAANSAVIIVEDMCDIIKIVGDELTLNNTVAIVNNSLDIFDHCTAKITDEEAVVQAVNATDDVMEKASSFLRSLNTNNQRKFVGESAAKVLATEANILKNIKSNDNAVALTEVIPTIINLTNQMIGNSKNAEVAQMAAQNMAKYLNAMGSVIDAMNSSDDKTKFIEGIKTEIDGFLKNSLLENSEKTAIQKAVTAISEKAKTKIVIVLYVNNPKMTINGAEKEIDPGRGTKPTIVNDRTLVPIASIIEAMGGTVSWDGTERRVDITLGSTNIKLWINKLQAQVNGQNKTLDVAPVIINDRTMLPLRFITENLGAEVGWDGTEKKITITYEK